MSEWRRFGAVEYGRPAPLVREVARTIGRPVGHARELLRGCGTRVRRLLQLEGSPIAWTDDEVQFRNIAGILRLAPGLELEVAPKFLGCGDGWREDFFFLAVLSFHGRLLDNEGLRSGSARKSDLATLIARSFVELYGRSRRRPLRTYRGLSYTGFSLEGDCEPENLLYPSEDGFEQRVTTFTLANPYNAVLRAAASRLATVVRDVETRMRVDHVARQLPRQAVPTRLGGRRLPGRSGSWQTAYDLAVDILRGFGGTFGPGRLLAPGFVVKTWQVWEDLVACGLRLGFGARGVAIQPRYRLGLRSTGERMTPVNVAPDAVVAVGAESNRQRVIVDAKYKGNVKQGDRPVSSSDLYEALAFSKAAGVNLVVLVYPKTAGTAGGRRERVGCVKEFADVQAGDTRVRAVEVAVRGVSEAGGLRRFADGLRAEICRVE